MMMRSTTLVVVALLIVMVLPASAGWNITIVIPIQQGYVVPQGYVWTPPPCGGYDNWGYQPQPRYNDPNASAYAEAYQNQRLALERQARYQRENMARQAGRAAAERDFGGGNSYATQQNVAPHGDDRVYSQELAEFGF